MLSFMQKIFFLCVCAYPERVFFKHGGKGERRDWHFVL